MIKKFLLVTAIALSIAGTAVGNVHAKGYYGNGSTEMTVTKNKDTKVIAPVRDAKKAPPFEAVLEDKTPAEKEGPKKPRFEDKRIEVNLASRLLTLYQGDVGIRMYPVAPGRPGKDTETPLGRRKVVAMIENPEWVDPDDEEHPVPSGPENPLGYRWIGIGGNYGIHGTNNPNSIGNYASHGCVRMYEKDVEDLFSHIVKGIPVDIIYERVVVQEETDHTVVYYIYPDGYNRQPLDAKAVREKLRPFGVAGFPTDDELNHAIYASDGNPHYVAKVYDLYVKGKKLETRAYGKDGHIYIPVFPVARAAGIRAEWSPNFQTLTTPYGKAPGIQKWHALYIDANDAPALLHLNASLDENYNVELN